MRFLAFIPVVFSATALILTFLAMFAGSSKGFMEDYAVVTMNTSRIGSNLLNTPDSNPTNNPFVNVLLDIANDVENIIEDALGSIAKDIGLHDFYSAHILTYCEGFYTPGPVPNASLPISNIHKNTTYCSRKTGTFYFNPTQILQNELDQAGHGNLRLQDLQWPERLEDDFRALRTIARVTFAFYCVSIALCFAALCLALAGVILEGRLTTYANISLGWTLFAVLLIASSIASYIATQSADLINKNGQQIGITASKGGKFLALTWAATGLIFVSSLVWSFDCFAQRRKHKQTKRVYTSEQKRI